MNPLKMLSRGGAVSTPSDPDFENTVLLLHGDGNQGATNFNNTGPTKYMAFTDNSDNNFPITVNGDAYGDNFSPFSVPEGYWSNYFDGSGDYLSLANQTALQMSTVDFTIEFWFYPTNINSTNQRLISTTAGAIGSNDLLIRIENDNTLRTLVGSTNIQPGSPTITANVWHHCAVVRSGGGTNNCSVYLDGTRIAQGTSTATLSNGIQLIGGYFSTGPAEYFYGYMSNVRVLKGVAQYSGSTITVPTTPLTAISGTSLLTCQSNRFVDNSSNAFAITRNGDVTVSPFTPFTVTPNTTDGSGYFDGTGDWLNLGQAASGGPLDLASAVFTAEAWVYITAIPVAADVISQAATTVTANSSVDWTLRLNTNRTVSFNTVSGSTQTLVTSTATINLNAWNHVAVVRSGTTGYVCVNGVVASGTVASTFNSNRTTVISALAPSGSYHITGYIADLRVLKGTALYTSSYTVPTAPLTAVSGTSLLTCQYQGTVRNVGFIDSSPYDHRITRNGNTTQGTFSPFSKVDGRWGLRTNDRSFLTIPASSDFDLISTDYTIEFWWKLNAFNTMASSGNNFFGNGLATASNGWAMGFGGSGSTVTQIQFITWAAGVRTNNYFTVSISTIMSEWAHIAIVRSGSGSGNLKCYVNGVAQGAAQNAGTYSTAGSTFTFGSGSYTQNGSYSGNADYHISNVRLTKSALYTSDFTPSTAPLTQLSGTVLLLCQSNRLINNGTNAGAITSSGHTATRAQVTPFSPFPTLTAYDAATNGGSGYFDGTGDYLTVADNASLEFGSGAFCIEMFLYQTASAASATLITKRANNTTADAFVIINVSGTLTAYFSSSSGSWNIINGVTFGSPTLNAWNHVAVYRVGNAWYGALNGVVTTLNASNSSSVSNNANNIAIGAENNAVNPVTGYISSARIVVGSSVYTSSNFTPPTAPLTAITNTSLLLNFTNAGIIDHSMSNNLETVGNAQIDTTTKKYGTGSMEFDGTGDYVTAYNNAGLMAMGSVYTIEMWFYTTTVSLSQQSMLMTQLPADYPSGRSYFHIHLDFAQIVVDDGANVNSGPKSASGAVSANTWTHLAIVADGSTTKIYLNGTQSGSTFNGIVNATAATTHCKIGGSGTFNGYIDDLRITKGKARYTSNFTPPTAAFEDIGE